MRILRNSSLGMTLAHRQLWCRSQSYRLPLQLAKPLEQHVGQGARHGEMSQMAPEESPDRQQHPDVRACLMAARCCFSGYH